MQPDGFVYALLKTRERKTPHLKWVNNIDDNVMICFVVVNFRGARIVRGICGSKKLVGWSGFRIIARAPTVTYIAGGRKQTPNIYLSSIEMMHFLRLRRS